MNEPFNTSDPFALRWEEAFIEATEELLRLGYSEDVLARRVEELAENERLNDEEAEPS